MRKSLFIAALLCLSGLVMAQEEGEQKVKGAHPYIVSENEETAQEYAHWSLIPHFGFNAFDGDFASEMKHNVAVPSAGLALEYSFTPVWSLGVEYMYSMYAVTGLQVPSMNNADTLLFGHMHKAGGYISMDLMNLFFPKAKRKIFTLVPYLGGGAAWYKRSAYHRDDKYWGPDHNGNMTLFNPTHGRGQTAGYVNADGKVGPDYDTKYNVVGYVQAGLNLEFNLNRTMALGVRANYTYFTRDYVDGRGYYKGEESSASKNNDGMFDVTLNMRFKLMAVSKTHVRNISSYEAWAKPAEPQCVHDTVIIRHDSIIIRETTIEHEQKDIQRVYYVYFDNNKSSLDEKSLITVQQVAEVMAEDTSLYAVVTGFCDNTGSSKLNYALGDKRAENVVSELREEHAVDTAHLYAMGMGKLVGRRSQAAYGPNRRASIRLVDKATFDRMKSDLDDKRAHRIDEEALKAEAAARAKAEAEAAKNAQQEPVKTIPLSESARPEKVNVYKQRAGEEVVADKTTTLSRLARQYYNNTYCWVYIYIANKDKISNPNDLTPGTTLMIPELTQEEMQITKDASLAVYGAARQEK